MAGPEIVKLKRILREKAVPPSVDIPLDQRRKGMEKVAFKAADDIQVENVTASQAAPPNGSVRLAFKRGVRSCICTVAAMSWDR